MPVQDRTNEFRACVDSIRNRSSFPARGAEQKQRLLQPNGKAGGSKSEFTRMASAIGKDISSTTVKLGKLAQREPLSSCCCRVLIVLQWRSGKRCLMIGRWRSACVNRSSLLVNPTPNNVHIFRNSPISSSKTLPISTNRSLSCRRMSRSAKHRAPSHRRVSSWRSTTITSSCCCRASSRTLA